MPTRPSRPALARTLALALLGATSLATGCGEEAPPPPAELPPLVGTLELPISFRNTDPAPSGALRIEAGTSELRLDGQPVYTGLENGRIAASEVTPEGLAQLLTRIRATPARPRAALTFMGVVPYDTAVRVVQTLATAGYHEVAFAVRPAGMSPTASGWLALSNPQVVPSAGAVTFPATRQWDEFTAHWDEMYQACRGGRYIDCDGTPVTPVQGGEVQLTLFTRGQGMQMRFNQVNAPAAEPTGPAAVAMIEGVPAPTPAAPAEGEEAPAAPDTNGVFSFRFEEATSTEAGEGGAQVPNSAISLTARPMCGAASCPTIIEADSDTPIMRVLSFVGAAFPSGTPAPTVALRLPAH